MSDDEQTSAICETVISELRKKYHLVPKSETVLVYFWESAKAAALPLGLVVFVAFGAATWSYSKIKEFAENEAEEYLKKRGVEEIVKEASEKKNAAETCAIAAGKALGKINDILSGLQNHAVDSLTVRSLLIADNGEIKVKLSEGTVPIDLKAISHFRYADKEKYSERRELNGVVCDVELIAKGLSAFERDGKNTRRVFVDVSAEGERLHPDNGQLRYEFNSERRTLEVGQGRLVPPPPPPPPLSK